MTIPPFGRKFLLLCLLFFYSTLHAQIIQGTISDGTETIPHLPVIFKDPSKPQLIFQYTTTNENGYYEIILKSALDSVIVEVDALMYEPRVNIIKNLQAKKAHTLDLQLRTRVTEIKEVVVEVKQPIRVKNDTVTYNPEFFKDGTERVVEDLLRKLPGVSVGENGEIKFKGKTIKKFLLDGDDLFDSQYTIGSKNIAVDMVEKVQAIENFYENPLLKGLQNSDEVGLNLVFKKGKTDFSGNANAGYGFQDKYDLSATGLAINSKLKGFGVAAYNNIGKNPSPYYFDSEMLTVEQMREDKYLVPQLIYQGSFYSQLQDKFHRINNNLYSSINTLYKFTPKVSAKANIDVYSDRLSRQNIVLTEYTINDQLFNVAETDDIRKKPTILNGALQVMYKVSDSLSVEYAGKTNYEETRYRSRSSNNGLEQYNNVKTTNVFTKHNITFTNRVNINSALTALAHYSLNRAPQDYVSLPGLALGEEAGISLRNNQFSRFDKENMRLNVEYYIKHENSKLQFTGGYNSFRTDFSSVLTSTGTDGEITTGAGYQNDLKYNVSMPYAGAGFSYRKNRFSVSAGIISQLYDFRLQDSVRAVDDEGNDFVISPLVKMLYNFSNKTSLGAGYSYNEIMPDERNLYRGIVQSGYRSFINNEPYFRFLKTHTYTLDFRYNDYFNLTNFGVSFRHNYRKNNFFTQNIITPVTTVMTSFLLETGNKDYNVGINADKHLSFLKTTMQFNGNYGVSKSKNIVNDSALRNIESRFVYLYLTERTGFPSALNFENKTTFLLTTFFTG